jgi:hypothetical protein
MIATAGVVRKSKKHLHYYGSRSYAVCFSSLSTTVGVVLYRITIYTALVIGEVVSNSERNYEG